MKKYILCFASFCLLNHSVIAEDIVEQLMRDMTCRVMAVVMRFHVGDTIFENRRNLRLRRNARGNRHRHQAVPAVARVNFPAAFFLGCAVSFVRRVIIRPVHLGANVLRQFVQRAGFGIFSGTRPASAVKLGCQISPAASPRAT